MKRVGEVRRASRMEPKSAREGWMGFIGSRDGLLEGWVGWWRVGISAGFLMGLERCPDRRFSRRLDHWRGITRDKHAFRL
jgi:hypothetical protein